MDQEQTLPNALGSTEKPVGDRSTPLDPRDATIDASAAQVAKSGLKLRYIAGASLVCVIAVAILDGLGVIQIPVPQIFNHTNPATTITTFPTTAIKSTSGSANDQTLNNLINASPSPRASITPSAVAVSTSPSAAATPPPPQMPVLPPTVGTVPNIDVSGPQINPAESAAEQARAQREKDREALEEAAKTSDMVAGDTATPAPTNTGPVVGGLADPNQASATAPKLGGATSQQQSAMAYQNSDVGGYLQSARIPAASRYEIWAGRQVRIQFDNAIMVDLPGLVNAHLIEDAKDSASGTITLIPRGTRLLGTYNDFVASGASRVQLRWTQAIFPDGSTLDLHDMGSSDPNGWSGITADVNNHTGHKIGTVILTSVSAAALAATNRGNFLTGQSPAAAAGQNILQAGQAEVNGQITQPPTLSVRAGTQALLSVDRTIVMPPYVPVKPLDERVSAIP